MCLILFGYRVHPRYTLVLAGNRDEFYARPSAPMQFWEEAPMLLAGRDLQAGGTWLGVTQDGRFAAITNYRDPDQVRADAPSRGHLVSDYLKGKQSPLAYLQELAHRGDAYNGFNLLVGDTQGLFYYSNQGTAPQPLAPGYYGLSNQLLNTPWPKVQKGRNRLAALLQAHLEVQPEQLLALLQDKIQAADEHLPSTGISLEWERILSPLFIESSHYGTCSSSVLQVNVDNGVEVMEKTWADGSIRRFQLQWPTALTD